MTTSRPRKRKLFPFVCLFQIELSHTFARVCLFVCVGHTPYISRLLFPRLFPCIKINVRPLSVAFTSKTHLKCKNHCHSSTLCFGFMDTFSVLARVSIWLSVSLFRFVSFVHFENLWSFWLAVFSSRFLSIVINCVCDG